MSAFFDAFGKSRYESDVVNSLLVTPNRHEQEVIASAQKALKPAVSITSRRGDTSLTNLSEKYEGTRGASFRIATVASASALRT